MSFVGAVDQSVDLLLGKEINGGYPCIENRSSRATQTCVLMTYAKN